MFIIMSIYLFMLNMITWFLAILFLLLNFKIMIEWNMFTINSMKFIYIMYLDWMTFLFFSTVTFISSLVMMYSLNYMKLDLSIKRFMMLIFIFVSSMILMIISPNILSILLGWDGLGLSSYCLVAYYMNKKSFNSSMITMLMNRIGDIMILILISLFIMYGSWNFLFINKLNFLLLFFITITAITKSAQIPFSSWLPMAMAAPTPISSLVHSSTLVTAGVYLMMRFNYLMNSKFMYFLMMLSCLTMFMAGSSANMEFDLKKIIALSTLSQLGLMIMTISMNLPTLAFFHLITHAMFKSLLFLCSGIMIHNYYNHQDIRFLSNMNFNMPFINLIFNIASLTLCGMPFLSGFYSKDLIIEMFLMNNFNWMIFIMMFMSMGLTISYTFRLFFYISLKNNKISMFNWYLSFNLMNYSILLLLILSMFYGSTLNWLLFSSMNNIFLPKLLKMLIYKILSISMIMGLFLPMMKYKIFKMSLWKKYYMFINMMWFLPFIMKKNKINLLNLNNKLIFFSDYTWLELLSSKQMIYYIKLLFKMKLIYKLNFLIMMIMILYMIFMILFI